MSKPKSSKLDPFASTLVDMELEKKTLPEMIAWLKQEGVTVASGTLSDYLSALRSERRQMSVLTLIATGSQQHKEVKSAFAKNPTASLDELIQMHKLISFQLATQAVDNPELIKIADQLTRTIIDYASGQTKAAQKERELKLAESKWEETRKKIKAAVESVSKAKSGKLDAATKKEILEAIDRKLLGEA